MTTKTITLYRIVDTKGRHIEDNLESENKAKEMIALFELLDKKENRFIPNFYKIEQQ